MRWPLGLTLRPCRWREETGKSWLAAHFFAEIKVGEDTLSKDQREGMEALYVWRETDNFDAIVEVLR